VIIKGVMTPFVKALSRENYNFWNYQEKQKQNRSRGHTKKVINQLMAFYLLLNQLS